MGARWDGFKNGVKRARNASLITALGIGGLVYLATSDRGKKFSPADVPLPDPIPQMPTPEQMLMQQPSAPMMDPTAPAGPAEGYSPEQWQRFVQAGRGQNPQIGNAAQPRMSAVAPESVRDLGAVPAASV